MGSCQFPLPCCVVRWARVALLKLKCTSEAAPLLDRAGALEGGTQPPPSNHSLLQRQITTGPVRPRPSNSKPPAGRLLQSSWPSSVASSSWYQRYWHWTLPDGGVTPVENHPKKWETIIFSTIIIRCQHTDLNQMTFLTEYPYIIPGLTTCSQDQVGYSSVFSSCVCIIVSTEQICLGYNAHFERVYRSQHSISFTFAYLLTESIHKTFVSGVCVMTVEVCSFTFCRIFTVCCVFIIFTSVCICF